MTALQKLNAKYVDINALETANGLMQWDRQVMMPEGGTKARTQQTTVLSRMAHELWTSDEFRRLLEEAEKEVDPDSVEGAQVRVYRREVDNRTKLPLELVERKARVSGESYEVWKRARAEADFAAMAPYYRELFDIAKETSALRGPSAHPYDNLIDLFDEGATFEDAKRMFESIKEPIVGLVREIGERGRAIDDSKLYGEWDQDALKEFAAAAAAQVGFDFKRGRLDLSPNAFCSNFSRGDVRMTSRPSDHIKGVVSSTLHEMGHGVYEQGSPEEWDTTILKGGNSLAVHESQSRLWENIVGRSLSFWKFFYPSLQSRVPSLGEMSLEDFWRGMNKVQPTFIRVGADELTYNLHILVRFELEVDMITGALDVNQLPEAWNAKYTEYLGITPPHDGLGVLQDVHWSRGSIGYFPTYSMGNLISGQVWAKLTSDLGDVDALMERGDFAPILGWLQERIYRKAKRYTPKDLVRQVTGNAMRSDEWLAYAREKFGRVYELGRQ